MTEDLKSFTEKLKANSSNLDNMSATVENPGIPLMRINGNQQAFVPIDPDIEKGKKGPKARARKGWDKFKRIRYENVGERLVLRKELFRKRRNVSDVAFIIGVIGVILMIIHMELLVGNVNGYTNKTAAAVALKVVIMLSSLSLVGVLIWYHLINVKLLMIDNNMKDWLLAVSPKNGFLIAIEILICIICPIPGDINLEWSSHSINDPEEEVYVPLDIIFSIPMFLRVFLLCRVMLLHSKLFADTRSQSLGALNKTKLNFYFVFKSIMYEHPSYVMIALIAMIFLTGSWALRMCEVDNEVLHHSYWNCLWLVSITFLTVGYGDVVPHTYCGRAISVSVGMLGAGCTALVVAVLAQKLELTRSEKYVHNFVIECELDKTLKDSAVRIVTFAWRLYKGRKNGESESNLRGYHRHLLKAIDDVRKTKNEQRKMVDSQVTVLEVYRNQSHINTAVENIITKQDDLEASLEIVKNQVGFIGTKLDELCRIMSARKDRRESRRTSGYATGQQDDLLVGD